MREGKGRGFPSQKERGEAGPFGPFLGKGGLIWIFWENSGCFFFSHLARTRRGIFADLSSTRLPWPFRLILVPCGTKMVTLKGIKEGWGGSYGFKLLKLNGSKMEGEGSWCKGSKKGQKVAICDFGHFWGVWRQSLFDKMTCLRKKWRFRKFRNSKFPDLALPWEALRPSNVPYTDTFEGREISI